MEKFSNETSPQNLAKIKFTLILHIATRRTIKWEEGKYHTSEIS
jgi:hypothetical protein